MQNQVNAIPAPPKQVPWNKGKVTGAKPTPTTSERIDHWIRMRRSLSLTKFSESEASNHTPSLADFTTTTPELKFSVHTAVCRPASAIQWLTDQVELDPPPGCPCWSQRMTDQALS
jgi:hypothetical protein